MQFTFSGNPFPNVAPTVPLVMFLWIPVVLYLFSRFPAKKALVISFITAWLYLPQAELDLPGLPDYTKVSATIYGIVIATILFDAKRITSFRFSLLDIPMAIWCVAPFFASITNELGVYDGLSTALTQTVTWGIPYFLGRIYLCNLEGLRLLATGIFIGGLSYIPLCLFENRFSPQLHRIVYGDHAFADFGQSVRLGGYRPTVFLQHGLAVGAFMMVATLAGIWLWQSGTIKQLWGMPMSWLVGIQFVAFVLVRSSGAYGLLVMGLSIMLVARYLRTALPVYLMILAIAFYLGTNALSGNYFADQLVALLEAIFPADRVQSLVDRFNNEELLVDRARQQFWFGWGEYGRALVRLEYGRVTVQDSLWIIAFGHNGIVGLTSLFTAMLLPVAALFTFRYPASLWFNPKVAPAAVISIGILLYMVDCVLNALINPIYILAAGGVAGLALKPREKLHKQSRTAFINRQLAHQQQ